MSKMPNISGTIIGTIGVGVGNVEVIVRGPLHGHKEKLELDPNLRPLAQLTQSDGSYTVSVKKEGWYEVLPQPSAAAPSFDSMSRKVLVPKPPGIVPTVDFVVVPAIVPGTDPTPHPQNPDEAQRRDLVCMLDTLSALQHLALRMWYQGHDSTEIWTIVKRAICYDGSGPTAMEAEDCGCGEAQAESGEGAQGPLNVTCKTCRDRYYTPGTPYYMNYPAYIQCINTPCT